MHKQKPTDNVITKQPLETLGGQNPRKEVAGCPTGLTDAEQIEPDPKPSAPPAQPAPPPKPESVPPRPGKLPEQPMAPPPSPPQPAQPEPPLPPAWGDGTL